MFVKIASFIFLITIFNRFSTATICCKFKPQQLVNGSESLIEGQNEAVKTEQKVDIGKSLILRQLVGTLASLMRYEARKESPSIELDNHVDGIVIEAETPIKYLSPDHPRRKALLIVGEMAVHDNKKSKNSSNIDSNQEKEILEKDKSENDKVIAKLYKDIEDEKKVENLRRQEWTKWFLKHRQDELRRREEWQVKDDKIREEEVIRRQEWSEIMKKKMDILTAAKPVGYKPNDASPANTLIHSLFDALEAIKNKNNSA